MPDPAKTAPQAPVSLLVAAGLVAVQGLFLVGYAVLELFHLTDARVALGLTTAIFFATFGAGLLACARGLSGVRSWARGPVVVTQLIQLLVAWSFRGGESTRVAVVLASVAVVVLATLLHPASTRALAADPT